MREATCQYVQRVATEDDGQTPFVHCGLNQTNTKMLQEELFTDATLVVQGHSIAVHRAVLAANSPVFKRLFSCHMTEGENSVPSASNCNCLLAFPLLLLTFLQT